MRAFLIGLGVCLGLVLLSAPALAQTHPCDAFTPQVTVPVGTVTMDMCWDEKNAAGVTTPAKQYAIILDGTRSVIQMTKTTPTANATGKFLFSGPYTLTTPGTHTVIFEVVIDNGSGGNLATQSAPLSLTVQAAASPPSVPAPVRVSPSGSRR